MLRGVKNFSVGICDGAPSTARSSVTFASALELATHSMSPNFLIDSSSFSILCVRAMSTRSTKILCPGSYIRISRI